ncbi:HlyD family secretion protein [Sulfitobacter litoralis]|uniref:Membrane fusion protein (MFP) family protein n=1 Tax=Sulfitobacter litoralis TaxID=335975 RepID=A0ABY0SR87_9RHOB|nr:HlyD family type I secretion periplasmic adaptor subunit [Sulfitobacter litoralis]SDP53381.1 HlyD family secretion protein [Sulfitobacter litoralis]
MSVSGSQPFSTFRIVAVGYIALFALLGGFAMWAMSSQIAGAIVAPGKIKVDGDRQIVQHEIGGVVLEILVDDGDIVRAGDLLFRLEPQQLSSRLNIVEGQLYGLMARRGRLEAERDSLGRIKFGKALKAAANNNKDLIELMEGQSNLLAARLATVARRTEHLNKRSDQVASQITGIEAQSVALERQLALLEEELAGQKFLLKRGLSKVTAFSKLQREKANLQGQIGQLIASKAQAEQRITEIGIEVLMLRTNMREEAISSLRDLRDRETELVEKRLALKAEIERLDIRAPVSGIVYELLVQTPNSVVKSAEPLMHLVPQDRPLVIVARVMPTQVDQINVGQVVNLRMTALDQRSTPELEGEILRISPDAVDDSFTGETYFSTEIAFVRGELDRLPVGTILLPGMPVEAFIRTADRTPLSYLLKPLTDYFSRAFREN